MSSKPPEGNANVAQELIEAAQSAASAEEFQTIVERLEKLAPDLGDKALNVAHSVFVRLKSFTFESADLARGFIVENLFEWCCKTPSEDAHDSKFHVNQLRSLLKNWLYQYPHNQAREIRRELLQKISQRIESKPTKALLWMIATIGFRDAEIARTLECILQAEENPLNDTVLGVLVGLGVPPDKFDWLLDIVAERLKQKRLTRGCVIAVQELPGPRRTELAKAILELAEEKFPDEDDVDFSLACSVASRVADRSKGDSVLHDELWDVFRNHFRTISMTPDYAKSCNTQKVTHDYCEWLIKKSIGNDETNGKYLIMSRIAELIQPRQLEAWDDVDSSLFSEVLKNAAIRDTKNSSRGMCTSQRAKTLAWEIAVAANCEGVDDWIDVAIIDETSPYTAESVAQIVACSPPENLSSQFLQLVVTAPPPAIGFDSEWLRYQGAITLASSCGSRSCFDALLQFGLTRRGEVLLSTLNAIINCAVIQLEERDNDVVEKLLDKTLPDNEEHHRKAAISAICELAIEEYVSVEQLTVLWRFVSDTTLDLHSRCVALEAVGHSAVEISDGSIGTLRHYGLQDESDLGWRACEAMIRRNSITPADEVWLFEKLGLKVDDGGAVNASDAKSVQWWQAYLTGLLFRDDPQRFARAMAAIVESAKSDSLYQVVGSIEFHRKDCPEIVAIALVKRIRQAHSFARSESDLFKTLFLVSEAKLLTLAEVVDWKSWRPGARSSLCEAIGWIAKRECELQSDAIERLMTFTMDASFQVRRSAFRALSIGDPDRLFDICAKWSRTVDVEFRKRGAEATTWLPQLSFSDESILTLGYAWDEEPMVRNVWKGTLEGRHQKQLAQNYLELVLAGCQHESGVASTYRYGRALERIGDDMTINQIQDFIESENLKPNVFHFLQRLTKTIKKNWKKVTDKWPEPWGHETGVLEETTGTLIIEGREPLEVKLSLRCQHRRGPSDLSEWSARAVAKEHAVTWPFQMTQDPVELHIEGRTAGIAHVYGMRWQNDNSQAVFTLGGTGEFPTEVSNSEIATNPTNLLNGVIDVLHESKLELVSGDADSASKEIHKVIEKTNLAFLEGRIGGFRWPTRKSICEQVALVVSSLVDLFVPSFESASALGKIANAILKEYSLTLHLGGTELELLQEIARKDDKEATEELLFWLIERVKNHPVADVAPMSDSSSKPS